MELLIFLFIVFNYYFIIITIVIIIILHKVKIIHHKQTNRNWLGAYVMLIS